MFNGNFSTFVMMEYLLLQLKVLELHLLQLGSLGLQLFLQPLSVALAKTSHFALGRRESEANKRKIPEQKHDFGLQTCWVKSLSLAK